MDINPPKCNDIDYINFLISASNVFSCTEAAKCYLNVAKNIKQLFKNGYLGSFPSPQQASGVFK